LVELSKVDKFEIICDVIAESYHRELSEREVQEITEWWFAK
jgi:hypothetical protein